MTPFSLLLLAALSALHLPATGAKCVPGVYELTFTNLFTPSNFPSAPSSAHLSPLTAFSHSRRFSAFVPFAYATPGVRDVAETGDNTVLKRELRSPLVHAVAATTSAAFEGDPPFVLDIPVDCAHPFVSAISMIAPSPDWIVAIFSLDMRAPDGSLAPKRSGSLRIYDAGTDAGQTLTAPDKVSDPVQNIAPLNLKPFGARPAARYVLKLKAAKPMADKMANPMRKPGPMKSKCPSATYRLTVRSLWAKPRFASVPPTAGFSPLTAASHSRRFSAFTLYGYASPGVKEIAETGDNSVLAAELADPDAKPFVKDVVAADGPTPAGARTSVDIEVDCTFSVISFLQMVAPSPDWIVGAANIQTFVKGKFVARINGPLRVYDAGTDSGETLMAMDEETSPRENIAPLLGSPFNGRAVARYTLRKL